MLVPRETSSVTFGVVLRDVGDVERALPVELLARISGDRDGNVEQQLVAAACGDDDRLVAAGRGRVLGLLVVRWRVGLVSDLPAQRPES